MNQRPKNHPSKKALAKAIKMSPNIGENTPVNSEDWNNRVLIFTPSRGLLRHEWVQARYGQVMPCNWSMVEFVQFCSPYVPIGYQLADAQNLMAKKVVEGDYQWILYIEDDNVIPPDLFLRVNEYIQDAKIPVVSGLYFTKSQPAEPLIYRGLGNSYFGDWKIGDLVWADGIPFGCRLEHAGLVKEAWKNSPEYIVGGETTRRVFEQPNRIWLDPETGNLASTTGTTDLAWCKRIMEEKLFGKAGFPEFDEKQYPFLVDTNIFVRHIDQNGRMYPLEIPKRFLPDGK